MPGRPRITLAVVALVTIALLPAALRVRVDSAVERLLPAADPARERLEWDQRTFGSEEIVLIALFADDVFAPETLARVRRITDAVAALDMVRRVTSLANLDQVRDGPDGLGRSRVLPPPPWTPARLARLRADVEAHPLARGGIVSPDGRAAGLIVHLQPMSDDALLASDLPRRLRAILETHGGPEAFAITGLPVLKVEAAGAMVRDVFLFFAFGILAVGTVLLAGFRTVRGVVLPLGSVVVGLVWTSAIMTLAGDAYSLGTLVLAPLLLSVGVAYAIHVMGRWEHERASGDPATIVVGRALGHVGLPVVMAAITTLAGFAAFLRNPIPTIHDFGVYAAIGLACMVAATLVLLPSALAVLRSPAGTARAGWVDGLVAICTRAALTHRTVVLSGAAALGVVAALGVGRIAIETDYLRFFAPTHPARVANARVATELIGTQVIAVTVRGDGPESLTRVEAVAALRDLVAFVATRPGVDHVTSWLDHLHMLRDAIEPATAAVPLDDQRALDQRIALLGPDTVRDLLSADHAAARLLVYTRLSASREIETLARRVEDFATARLPPALNAYASGSLVLLTRSADVLARQQVAGLSQVFVALTILLVALFRSLRLGLLSLVPNLFPVVVLFGIMGWAGIDLNVSTSMIACIAIGIAVDDTIHYLSIWKTARRELQDDAAAVTAAAGIVGRPIVLTSAALMLGFLVPCLSTFEPVRHFGVLASATMVVALFADLLLLPALLARGRAPRHRGGD